MASPAIIAKSVSASSPPWMRDPNSAPSIGSLETSHVAVFRIKWSAQIPQLD